MSFMQQLAEQPLIIQLWIYWMATVNLAGVLFLKRPEGRAVVLVFLGNAIFMQWLFTQVGYVKLLGLSHILFWTPLAVWLYLRRENFAPRGPFGIWGRALLLTICVSLIIDYLDVIIYITNL